MENYFEKPRAYCRGCMRRLNCDKMYGVQMPICLNEMYICVECYHSKPHVINILEYPNRMAPPPLSIGATGDVDEDVFNLKQCVEKENKKIHLLTSIEKNVDSGGEDIAPGGEEKFLKKAEKFLLKLFTD